ncbi:SusC/RagA family TonB-linked outer membrane protein [Haliscomenobacter sp.]|uniref:SusC/RagA family TonB-linked outer membrane protein n=1 Tax=Haliscomenobacter sp. TaxID=2717303 RepID=UPI003BABCAE1
MKKHLLALALVVFAMASAVAQRAITGKVTDKSGGPLIGASILVKGTSSGSVTDVDGTYSLNAPNGATTLVVSYTGYATQEITLGTSNIIDVTLEESASQLGEVVVTAQGIRREKKALGYAVSTVGEELIADRPQADVGRVLQGKVPGVNITSTSGVSGTGTNITIRGYSSITGSVQPLFVVDGVPFNSNTNQRGGFTQGGQSASSRFLDLDPNNIESISVLKGLAATVTYGDQGRNGVILITTKSGSKKARKAEFSLTQSYFTNTAHLPKYQNDYVGGFQQNLGYFFSNWGPTLDEARTYPSQNTNAALTQHPYAFLSNAALRAAMADYVASVQPYKMQVFPNNVKDFFRTGKIYNTSLNVSGGSENVSYNVSAGYLNEEGYIPENGLKKLNLGVGLNAKLSKKLSVITSFTFANTDQFSPPLSGGTGNNALDFPSVLGNVMYTPRQVDLMGWPFESPVDGSSVYFRSGNDIPNPRWVLKNYKTTGVVNRIFSATTFNFEIAKDVNLLYKVGLDTYTEDQEFRFNKGAGSFFPNGAYFTRNINNTIWDNSVILSATKPIGAKLNVSARVGGNMRNDVYKEDGATSQNQLARNLFRHSNFIDNVASDGISEQTRMGIFGEVTVDYSNFLYLNFAGRNDWTSTVEKENRRIFYPSTSLSFIPTSAFSGLDGGFLNFLKIRAGVGTSAGFPNPYQTRNTLGQSARAWLNAAGAAVQSHAVSDFLGNPNLKPELHTEYEGGIEAKMFNNRLSFDLTVYRRDTRDLITNSPLDPATGYTSTTINIGKIRNQGIELSATITPVKNKDFNWDMTLTFSRNTPKVLDLGGTLQEVQITGFGAALGNYAIVGKPFNIIKGTGYRRNDAGQVLVDASGNLLTTASPVVLGDPNAAFNTSLINGINYKGFSFDFMISYRHGGAMYSSTAGALMGRGLTEDTGLSVGYDRAQTFLFPGVKADGTPNDIQNTAAGVAFNNLYFFGDEGRIYDGSTIRLQEVSLTYSLPQKMLAKTPFKTLSLAVSGTNLWYKALHFPPGLNFDTDNLGLGVGNGLGFEFLTGPSARRIGGTLKLTF